ncbi:hypothetical protein DFQ27_008506 [Actinomortierella ambigua]|uniref:Uncharacterized protein n=1 Tax=Actinomortierella ambigua TaxID=1343610 RepID=A0A9P6TYT1_9FUNG|nr:hypothetical protein DFQ27_008506 [Actinomortierella ambigua]
MTHSALTADCLPHIVDFVHDPGTLFSLLTASKAVFEIAVRALYKSPFRFGSLSKNQVRKLTCLLFSLLPPEAEESFALISDIRKCISNELFSKTYTNYLTLIRDIRTSPKSSAWALAHITGTAGQARSSRSRNFQPMLAWAVASHRLQDIRALTVHQAFIAPLQKRIDQLTSLQVLCVYHEQMSFSLHGFVQEFVRIHGDKGGRRLHLELRGELKRNAINYLDTFQLLDPDGVVAPSRIELSNFGPLYAYRDKADFGRVKEVFFHQTGYDTYLKSLLAKCYRLERLSLTLTTSNLDLLDWAFPRLHQDEETASVHINNRTARGSSTRALPPVREIAIDGDNQVLATTLDAALQVFGPTLEHVRIGDASLNDFEPADMFKGPYPRQSSLRRLSPGLTLPKLRRLFIDVQGPGVVFQDGDDDDDNARPPLMPMLEELIVFQRADKGVARHVTWPVLHLPRLRELRLNGRAAAEFNAGSLASMASLVTLHLDLRPLDWGRQWNPLVWKWDWSLPCLTELELVGLMATAFDFHALEHLPSLTNLALEAIGPMEVLALPQYPKRFSQGDADITVALTQDSSEGVEVEGAPRSTGATAIQRPGTGVKVLRLEGYWCIDDDVWRSMLFDWFPNLETLNCQNHRPVDIIVGMEWVRRHARIERWISTPKDNLPLEVDIAVRAKTKSGRAIASSNQGNFITNFIRSEITAPEKRAGNTSIVISVTVFGLAITFMRSLGDMLGV